MATIKELVKEHNALARERGVAELSGWKQSGEKLRERIDAMRSADAPIAMDPLALPIDTEAVQVLDDAAPDQVPPSIAEGSTERTTSPDEAPGPSAGPWTIGKAIRALLLDPAGLDYASIVERVKAEFPLASTSRRSVASVAAALRRDGVEVPMRRTPRRGD
jgi:hypothetical protein